MTVSCNIVLLSPLKTGIKCPVFQWPAANESWHSIGKDLYDTPFFLVMAYYGWQTEVYLSHSCKIGTKEILSTGAFHRLGKKLLLISLAYSWFFFPAPQAIWDQGTNGWGDDVVALIIKLFIYFHIPYSPVEEGHVQKHLHEDWLANLGFTADGKRWVCSGKKMMELFKSFWAVCMGDVKRTK